MQVNNYSVNPNLPVKVQEKLVENNIIVPNKTKVDKFEKSIDAHKVILAGSSAAAGLELGKKAGTKIASGLDIQLTELAKDFCKTPTKLMPEKIKSVVKWGSGALCAYYAASLVLTDKNQNGELDIIETVKGLLDPR